MPTAQCWFDKLLERIPIIGKFLATLFGLFEVPLLEFFRRLDNTFRLNYFPIFNRYILKYRWGGRVLPLDHNIDPQTKFLPRQEILKLIDKSNITGVSWCYCRSVQRKYDFPNCDHPLNTCIHLGYGHSLYEIPFKSKNLEEIPKNEVKELIEKCDDRGLIHQIIYFPNPQFYYVVCNCCSCCCVVLRQFLEYGAPQIIKSDFIAKTNKSLCSDCGDCQAWCKFGARIIEGGSFVFNPNRCFGCGICVSKCPNKAIILKKTT